MNCVTICCYSEKQCTRRTILKVKILGKTIKKMIQSSLLLGAMVCTINGCSFLDPGGLQENTEAIHTGAVTIVPGTYDSEDTAIVLYKNAEESTIQFQNLATGKRYTLQYDGATEICDKYGEAMSLQQIEPGSIVTARFYKPKKLLASMKVDGQALHFDELSNYALDSKRHTISVGETVYNLSNHLVILSEEDIVELIDINQVDVLSVWGYNNQIYSINIEQGHGYLRLQNDTYFVDGWIEIGQKIIRKISEDMLIVVPEGKTTVKVSHNGSSATQEITFARNEEMAWDLGDVEITEVQKGNIIFTLDPVDATVKIDGKEVNTSLPVELEYGVHQMTVKAAGYDTLSQYIKVREPSANIGIELEENEDAESSEEDEEETSSDKKTEISDSDKEAKDKKSSEKETSDSKKETSKTDSQNKTTSKSNSKYQVHIDSPAGAEVYVDGNYIGIAPVSMNKEIGNFVITLRKTGYQTRSYTVQIDDGDSDVNYSFAELMKLD